MATNTLKVDDLRARPAQRNLSTTGTKATLVGRLEAAIREESKNSADSNIDSGLNRKRKRDFDTKDSDIDEPAKVKAVYQFRIMNAKQLRFEAALRGISTTGTKTEILERLCADEEPNVVSNKGKMVTVVKKGSAVLDRWLPDHIKSQFHVLQIGDEVYDATLNQTNVGENSNNFCVLQVLESDIGGRFMVYHRWGTVGMKGEDRLNGRYISQQAAIFEFMRMFFEKTKNQWSNRKEFVTHPKCYTWLEMDYSETDKEPAVQEDQKPEMKIEPSETKLETSIAYFISLIFNVGIMKQQMMEIVGYNAEKLPLGRLSKSTILKGYDILKRIADVISKSDRTMVEQLSGEFYTVIPHDFGVQKLSQYIIDTPRKLKRKLEMVEALGTIELATKLLGDDIQVKDPLYFHYQQLRCELVPLEVGSREFSVIEMYMKNSHTKTHSNYAANIVQVFKVSRAGEAERFEKFSKTKNRMLLWHGSPLINWTGILSQGLRISPLEAPSTGSAYGTGIYFSDMFSQSATYSFRTRTRTAMCSKSANYCYSTPLSAHGVLLLCEVALGDMDMAELLQANHNARKWPEGKLSTKIVGAAAPDFSKAEILEDGLVVPLGEAKEQPGPQSWLSNHVYVVRDVDQIRMRYVVQVDFNFNGY